MPRFSAFTPFGQFKMSAAPSYVEQFYRLLPRLWGTEIDCSVVGSYDEMKLYAVSRMCALMLIELEHAGNQANPYKAYDLLPLLESDYLITPGQNDTVPTRQAAVAAAMRLSQGAVGSNVVNLLKSLVGAAFLAYVPNPAGTPTVFPASPGDGPGAFKDVNIPAKFLQIVDPVATIGTCWVAYQALDPSAVPTTVWSPAASFSVGQQVVPTIAGSVGAFFECTTAGTTGTTEPAWSATVGDTVVDGSVTWTSIARIADALVVGDVVVIDAGNTSQMEKVTVAAVANTPPFGSETTPGYLYFAANYTQSHDIGAPVTTGQIPYWTSTQRLNYVVLTAVGATAPPTRAKVDVLLAKILRGVSLWAIVQASSTTPSGGTVGPLSAGAPMGCVPLGTITFTRSI